jgi:diguanylate cyclase (GGDEF)-like protein
VKHEDFDSIEVEAVLAKVLDFFHAASKAKAVHWLSAYGLSRVYQSSNESWSWAFSTADVIGKHVVSRPAADVWDLFHVWRKVAGDYVPAAGSPLSPKALNVAPSEYFAYPMTFNGALLGVLLFEGVTKVGLRKELEIAAKYLGFAYQMLEAKNLSYLDELTGLYNQRYLPMVLEHEIERARREGSQFSLLFLDIDYFKMVNDGRGHWTGSKLLVELGQLLKQHVRACDYAFRYGGDEFIVLLGSSNAENSKKVAERIRKAVEEHTFQAEGQDLKLTVSIGLASYPEHAQSAAGLIQLADQAMYYGKRKSRNIVFVAS